MDAFDEVVALFDARGAESYGEAVTKRDHSLLTAAAARQAGHGPERVAAALLHDVGHLLGEPDDWSGVFDHAAVGGAWVEERFGAQVAGPVRLHVEAKRYLCAVEPGYAAGLSHASAHTLAHQGGPMDAAQRAAFEATPGWSEAVELRRLEDALGKRASAAPGLEAYRELLGALAAR